MTSIGLICAIPQESRPIIRRFPGAARRPLAGFDTWAFHAGNNPIVLMESGIGTTNAAAATTAMIESVRPDVILSIGFCGAIKPGIQIGDLVLAQRHYVYSSGVLTDVPAPPLSLKQSLVHHLNRESCRTGTFITAETFTCKGLVSAVIPDKIPVPVLEMESAAVVCTCRFAGIRVAALRAVSDTSDEDPAATVSPLFNQDFTINRLRAARTILGKPWLLPQLLGLAGNAKRAGDSLARGLVHTLEKIE